MTDALKHIQPFAIGILFVLLYAAEHISPQRVVSNNLRHDGENVIYGMVNLLTVFTGGYFSAIAILPTAKAHWTF